MLGIGLGLKLRIGLRLVNSGPSKQRIEIKAEKIKCRKDYRLLKVSYSVREFRHSEFYSELVTAPALHSSVNYSLCAQCI